jgi:flagellum-specific peptidoglycan hydrolase FlgJ
MKGISANDKTGVSRFVRDNWFKLLLVVLAIYVFFQKDLSFQVQLNAPAAPGPAAPPTQVDGSGKREKMSQRKQKASASEEKEGLFDLTSALQSGNRKSAPLDALEQLGEDEKMAYLKRFARVALSEQQKFGVPASIILANALLHSTSGQAAWASSGNNHFALPCTESWTGESGLYQGQCLRHYENAWTSFRDHSLYLRKEWSDQLPFDRGASHKEWATALAKGPYGNEAGMAPALLDLIERYRLFELDEKP